MSDNKLTQKQETFTQNLFKGLTQREAWIQAGYSSKYDLALVDIHACALAATDKVKIRLAELNQPIIERIIASKEAKLQTLEDIYGHVPLPETITARDRVHAIAEHNKMQGDYEPVKVDLTAGLEELLSKLHGRRIEIGE